MDSIPSLALARETKTYLGDGAYAAFDGWYVILTTEDGICVQNRVCLGPDELASLDRFLRALRAANQ